MRSKMTHRKTASLQEVTHDAFHLHKRESQNMEGWIRVFSCEKTARQCDKFGNTSLCESQLILRLLRDLSSRASGEEGGSGITSFKDSWRREGGKISIVRFKPDRPSRFCCVCVAFFEDSRPLVALLFYIPDLSRLHNMAFTTRSSPPLSSDSVGSTIKE